MSRAATVHAAERIVFNQLELEKFRNEYIRSLSEYGLQRDPGKYHKELLTFANNGNPEASNILATAYLIIYFKTYKTVIEGKNKERGNKGKYTETIKKLTDIIAQLSTNPTAKNLAIGLDGKNHQPLLALLEAQTQDADAIKAIADKDNSRLRGYLLANIIHFTNQMTLNAETMLKFTLESVRRYSDERKLEKDCHKLKKSVRDTRTLPANLEKVAALCQTQKVMEAADSVRPFYEFYIHNTVLLKDLLGILTDAPDDLVAIMRRTGEILVEEDASEELATYLEDCDPPKSIGEPDPEDSADDPGPRDGNPSLPTQMKIDLLLKAHSEKSRQDLDLRRKTLRTQTMSRLGADGFGRAKQTMTLKKSGCATLARFAAIAEEGADDAVHAGGAAASAPPADESTLRRQIREAEVVKVKAGGKTIVPGASGLSALGAGGAVQQFNATTIKPGAHPQLKTSVAGDTPSSPPPSGSEDEWEDDDEADGASDDAAEDSPPAAGDAPPAEADYADPEGDDGDEGVDADDTHPLVAAGRAQVHAEMTELRERADALKDALSGDAHASSNLPLRRHHSDGSSSGGTVDDPDFERLEDLEPLARGAAEDREEEADDEGTGPLAASAAKPPGFATMIRNQKAEVMRGGDVPAADAAHDDGDDDAAADPEKGALANIGVNLAAALDAHRRDTDAEAAAAAERAAELPPPGTDPTLGPAGQATTAFLAAPPPAAPPLPPPLPNAAGDPDAGAVGGGAPTRRLTQTDC
ncbi:MAG: hypothetical protein K0U29_02920 [Gammaproteobacteria bacterium]|nr:hypothetical protein [Gammaproteobacteria bacterium]